MIDLRSPRLLALTLLAVLAAPSRHADACGNGVERVVDRTNQSIRGAEALLAEGKYQAAADAVLQTFPKALRLDHREAKQNLFERGQRVLAVAVVRSQGAIKLGKQLPGKSTGDRATSLAWATTVLRVHNAQGLGGLALTAELAEGLALRPAEASDAYDLLKKLAADDLMPTPRAWAILGSLEQARGDAAAADKSVQRCKEIAPDPKQCEVIPNS